MPEFKCIYSTKRFWWSFLLKDLLKDFSALYITRTPVETSGGLLILSILHTSGDPSSMIQTSVMSFNIWYGIFSPWQWFMGINCFHSMVPKPPHLGILVGSQLSFLSVPPPRALSSPPPLYLPPRLCLCMSSRSFSLSLSSLTELTN